MARRGKDNDHTKFGQLRQRGQYRIQHVMMMNLDLLRIFYCEKKLSPPTANLFCFCCIATVYIVLQSNE